MEDSYLVTVSPEQEQFNILDKNLEKLYKTIQNVLKTTEGSTILWSRENGKDGNHQHYHAYITTNVKTLKRFNMERDAITRLQKTLLKDNHIQYFEKEGKRKQYFLQIKKCQRTRDVAIGYVAKDENILKTTLENDYIQNCIKLYKTHEEQKNQQKKQDKIGTINGAYNHFVNWIRRYKTKVKTMKTINVEFNTRRVLTEREHRILTNHYTIREAYHPQYFHHWHKYMGAHMTHLTYTKCECEAFSLHAFSELEHNVEMPDQELAHSENDFF